MTSSLVIINNPEKLPKQAEADTSSEHGDKILKVSVFSLYMYKIFGIVQFPFGERNTYIDRFLSLSCPLPFFCLFIYLSIDLVDNIMSEKEDVISSGGISIVELVNIGNTLGKHVWYFIVSQQLRSLLIQIKDTDVIFTEYGEIRAVNRLKYYMLALGLSTLLINCVCAGTTYLKKVVYYCTDVVEIIFVSEILRDLYLKYTLINQKMIGYKTPVDLRKVFPLTKEKVILKLKNDDKDFHMNLVQELSHWHYKLTHLSLKFNDLVSVPLLSCLAATFASLTSHPYEVFTWIKSDGGNSNYFIWIMIQKSSHFMFQFIRTCFVIHCWTNLADKANYSVTLVHDIWNKYALLGETDTKIQHLQLISVRLLNTRLLFTARGFFPIDWSCLHMIVAAVTTYVIILIQFQIT